MKVKSSWPLIMMMLDRHCADALSAPVKRNGHGGVIVDQERLRKDPQSLGVDLVNAQYTKLPKRNNVHKIRTYKRDHAAFSGIWRIVCPAPEYAWEKRRSVGDPFGGTAASSDGEDYFQNHYNTPLIPSLFPVPSQAQHFFALHPLL